MRDRLYRVFPKPVDGVLTNTVKKLQTLARSPCARPVAMEELSPVKTLMLLLGLLLAAAPAGAGGGDRAEAPAPARGGARRPRPAAAIPMPKLRPAPAPAGGGSPRSRSRTAEPDGPRSWPAAEVADGAAAPARKLLDGLDLDYRRRSIPSAQPGGCGAPAPVSVSRVAGVALTPAATLTCDMAAALHGWVSGTLQARRPASASRPR